MPPTMTPMPTPTGGLQPRFDISIPESFSIPTSIDINWSVTLPSSIGGITLPTSLPGITVQVNTPSGSSTTPSPTSSDPSSTSSSSSSTPTSSSSTPTSSPSSSGSSKPGTAVLAGVFTAVALLFLILLVLLLWHCRRRRRRRSIADDEFAASGYTKPGYTKPGRSASGRTWWRPRGGNAGAATPSLRSDARSSSDAFPHTSESPMAFAGVAGVAYAAGAAHERRRSEYEERHSESMHAALLAPPPAAMTPGDGLLSPTSTYDPRDSALVSPASTNPYNHGSYFPTQSPTGPGFARGDPSRYALLGGAAAAGGAPSADPFADDAASSSSGTTTDVPMNAAYTHAFGMGPNDPDYLFVDHGAGAYPWMTYPSYRRTNTGNTSVGTGSVFYQTGGMASTSGSSGSPGATGGVAGVGAGGHRVPFPRQYTDESAASAYFTPASEDLPPAPAQARRTSSNAHYGEWFGTSASAAAAGAGGMPPLPPPPARSASSSVSSPLPTIHEGEHAHPMPAGDGLTPGSVADERDYVRARHLTVANE